MYKVSITSRAEKDLRKLDRQNKNRILTALMKLADDARPDGCRRVLSEPGVWRIRIGDWRIGYTITDDQAEITVLRIAHRSDFYD